MTLPNLLTILRLLAAPGVAVVFLYFARPWADWYALVLFFGAAITDFFDGYLAREWKQVTKLGTMLDPIADKAMVVIALMVIVGYSERSWTPWYVLPATFIVFREVFVSGLREFLGDTAGTLKVTKLAKWKTTLQMVAIGVLFSQGIFEHHVVVATGGMDAVGVCKGFVTGAAGPEGLAPVCMAFRVAGHLGLWLLWFAALLTLVTGWDYFSKARPYLKD